MKIFNKQSIDYMGIKQKGRAVYLIYENKKYKISLGFFTKLKPQRTIWKILFNYDPHIWSMNLWHIRIVWLCLEVITK